MFSILKALIRIAKEVRRIREVLEIAHADKLDRFEYAKGYSNKVYKENEVEFDPVPPKLDPWGEPIVEEEDEETRIT